MERPLEAPVPPESPLTIRFKHTPTPGLISVIIPVFEDAAGLAETLSSLVDQTLSPTEYEIIVANDGASPAISEACRNFSVREVRVTPNRGAYFARNRAMEEAKGENFALVDADIEVQENWLEVGKSALHSADYVGGPAIVPRTSARTPAEYHNALTGFRSLRAENEHRFFGGGNMFVTRKVIEDIGGFDERLRSGGDNEFGNRVFQKGKHRQQFVDELAVSHPPRDYHDLVKKRVRVHRGRRVLNSLYPDRYNYRRRPLMKHLLDIILPPSPAAVSRGYPSNPHFGLLRYYLFRWRFKAEVALRLLPVHYGRIGAEASIDAVTTVHEPGVDGAETGAPPSPAEPIITRSRHPSH